MPLFLLLACAKDEPEDTQALPGGDLSLDYPAAAEWADAGTITATATAHNVTTLTIDGVDATHEGPRYAADVKLDRGINVVEAVAVDARGDTLFARHGVIAGDFASPDGEVRGAMAVRANQGALDKAGELAVGMIDVTTLNDALTAVNPVYSDTYIWDTVTVQADITSVDFSTPRIEITPTTGRLTLTATIPDLDVQALAYADALGYDFDSVIGLWADEAVVTGELIVTASNGNLEVALDGATVELVEFGYSTDLLPDWVTDYLLVETIRDTIEEQVVTQIETLVPPMLEETLGGLDPSFSTELLGVSVDLAFTFASVNVDPDGLAIGLDMDVSIPQSGTRTYTGYLTAPDGDAEEDTTADVSGAISDDLLNRVLFEAWAGGMLDLTLSTDDGSLEPFMLAALKAEEGTIRVTADLPPVAVEKDGELVAQVGEMIIDVSTPGGELGEHIVLALAADIPLEITLEGGEIKLALGEPAIVFEVRESDWGASNETVTRLIEEMLPLDTLLALLGDFAFPIPALYGLEIDSGRVERDGSGVHTDMQVWLR